MNHNKKDKKLYQKTNEETSTSSVFSYETPFAFSKRKFGNPEVAQMFGNKITDIATGKKSKKNTIKLDENSLFENIVHLLFKNKGNYDLSNLKSIKRYINLLFHNKPISQQLKASIDPKVLKIIKKYITKKISEGQMYPGFDGIAVPPDVIDMKPTYLDKHGLPQHGDPNESPAFDGYDQGDKSFKAALCEKYNNKNDMKIKIIKLKDLLNEINGQYYTDNNNANSNLSFNNPPKQLSQQLYDINSVFDSFDNTLKNATEQTIQRYQNKIQNALIGKKIIARAAKGYKQPEEFYTINVTGVRIDYYYGNYTICLIGKEEHKQKTSKFFINPGFKIRIVGKANLRGNDAYEIQKSKAIASNQPLKNMEDATNSITRNVTANI